MNQNGHPKKLRFAALRRVSTEQQEKTGESLRTQKKEIEEAVARLGGVVVEWYGGQEHATPGHERKELNRLLQDAERTPCRFDAVIVSHPDRWSRDNSASRAGLQTFQEHAIRFFAGETEFDLFNPDHELFLGISAVVGQFQARTQMRKSLVNRINRAKRGIPTSGKLPFGRKYVRSEDGEVGRWELDDEKAAMVRDCARRYLAGESMKDLAAEYNVNHSNLHKVLTKVAGGSWQLRFQSKVLNIDETVPFQIPALLPDEMIAAVIARSDSNRTFTRSHIKHQYLFSRMIRCGHCGYAMFGQFNHNGLRYYRHAHTHRDQACPGPNPKCWIPADSIEDAVMRHLFETFGNPVAVEKAIQDAVPNDEKIREALAQQAKCESELRKAQEGLDRILDHVAEGTISKEDATKRLQKYKERKTQMEAEIAKLQERLSCLPDAEKVRKVSEKIGAQFRRYASTKLAFSVKDANRHFEAMSFEERRKLCQMVFSGRGPGSEKLGLSVSWSTPKSWRYRIEGHFIDEEGGPLKGSQKDLFVFGAPIHQKDLVTKNANHCTSTSPPARRCGAPTVPQCR